MREFGFFSGLGQNLVCKVFPSSHLTVQKQKKNTILKLLFLNTYLRQNASLTNSVRQKVSRRKGLMAKCPHSEISLRRFVLTAISPTTKKFHGEKYHDEKSSHVFWCLNVSY